MKRPTTFSAICVLLFLALFACSPPETTAIPTITIAPTIEHPTTSGLTLILETDYLMVWAAEDDRQTAQDIAGAIQANAEQVCSNLQTACQFSVVIEVYPDQPTFDQYVMNQEMRGYFAISGDNTIQMVSPADPAPREIAYEDGVAVAVHEFVHLALDEINPLMPTWLDEGAAIYVGPHAIYSTVCHHAFPFAMLPSFPELVENYAAVPAADLFAFTAVEFIVSEYGLETLNALLRSPDDLAQILGISPAEFETYWIQYMSEAYQEN